jgi:hypothetical protein
MDAVGPRSGVVAGGCQSAWRASIDRIREEVRREYAGRLESAGWVRRCILRVAMRREVSRRMEKVAPRGGLYLQVDGSRPRGCRRAGGDEKGAPSA